MKTTIIVYQILALLAAVAAFSSGFVPVVELAAVGVVASVLRCLREFYSRLSAKKWENSRLAWFFLRPVVGAVAGGVAYFAIRAFLPSLGVQEPGGGLAPGFVLLAFVAGFCVDDVLNLFDASKKRTVVCDCGAKNGCRCGCGCGCGCASDCDCGCKDGRDCDCGAKNGCRCGCGCASDCDCGCKDGRDCNCDDKNGCRCGCGCPSDCDCGCKDGRDCDCADVEKKDVDKSIAEQPNEAPSNSPASDKKEAV